MPAHAVCTQRKRRRSLFSIVGGKHEVPQSQDGDRTGHVNQQKASHTLPLMPMVRPRLRRSKGGEVTIQPSQGAKLGFVVENSERSSSEWSYRRLRQPAIHPAIRGNRPATMSRVPFTIRDFQPRLRHPLAHRPGVFPPGISYSRAELKLLHAPPAVLHAGSRRARPSVDPIIRKPKRLHDLRAHRHRRIHRGRS